MKKLLTKIYFITALVATFVPSVIFAADSVRQAPSVESILPAASVYETDKNNPLIPMGDLETSILPAAIKMFLSVVATISFAMFIYAGVNLIISQGNEEEMTKFKSMLIWSVVGLVIITMAYAVVKGVLDLNFEI